ncbi:MAG: hypothetical protein U0237_07445 [Thermoleophilia bacterium]
MSRSPVAALAVLTVAEVVAFDEDPVQVVPAVQRWPESTIVNAASGAGAVMPGLEAVSR